MQERSVFAVQPHRPLLQRLAVIVAAILAGLLACAALLVTLGGPVSSALAAPASGPVIYPGGTGCTTTLQACINGTAAGSTIQVQAGTYITNGLTLSKAISLTGVSSATVILKPLGAQRVLTVTGAAVNSSVIISGLTFAGGHAVGSDCPAGCGGAILITATARPLLSHVTISNSQADYAGGGVYADITSQLVLSSVAVLSNTAGAGAGGGAFAWSLATINGGVFQNNRCTGADCLGGGLVSFGNMTLNGGLFQDNQCTGAGCQGGGVYDAGGELDAINSQFLSNTSNGDGGGANGLGVVNVNGGLFQDNKCVGAGCRGAGLFSAFPFQRLTAINTRFLGNISLGDGGGANIIGDNALVTLAGDLFQNNQCTAEFCAGGGLFDGHDLTATNSDFLSNTSNGNGGGALVDGNATLTGGSFLGNTSNDAGGGLDAVGNLTATNTQFVSNTSILPGGGASAGNVALSGSLFQNNHCTGNTFPFVCSGGGLRALNLTATNSQFLGNSSIGGGGGAFSQFGIVTLTEDVFQNNQCTGAKCQGGGLFAENNLGVTNTLFVANIAQQGAGLYQGGGSGRLVNDLFAANQASLHGDAVFLASPGAVSLLFTTIASPTVGGGSAVYVTTGTVGITDTLIASYTVGLETAGGNVREAYNLFSGVGSPYSGTVTIGGHSHLTGPANFVNPAAGDYHLIFGSAAIGAGVDTGVNFDIDGDPRPLAHGFDIGYDEVNLLFLPVIQRAGCAVSLVAVKC